jgi:hypothetical protein
LGELLPFVHAFENRGLIERRFGVVVSPPIAAFASKKMKGDITLPKRALDL